MIKLSKQIFVPDFKLRSTWILRFFFFIIISILVRALYLQVIERSDLEERAARQYEQSMSIKLQRGQILDSKGEILAVSLPMDSIFAIPQEVNNPLEEAQILSKVLDIESDDLFSKLTSKKSFIWLKRNALPRVSKLVESLGLSGIHKLKEYQRFYPNQNLAAQLIGFSGIDSQGLEGIEYKFNEHLMNGSRQTMEWNPLIQESEIGKHSGGTLSLTIDSKIQYYAEKELRAALEVMEAKHGIAIVMESQTGKILALANLPDYDPNNFSKFDNTRYFNRAIGATYEPGSTFKIITIAAALDNDVIAPNNIFFCEEGAYQIQDRVIHDTEPHGWLTLEKIIQKSSNICIAKIGQLIAKPLFYKMIQEFGFSSKSGINLPGEASGRVHNYTQWSDTDVATISFGHTVSATPIQVITAMNVIATGGLLVTPKVIKEKKNENGEIVTPSTTAPKRIIKQSTAELVKSYMVSVAQRGGTGFLAAVDDVEVAGKTGTSRKFDSKSGEYSTEHYISSFAGFFPANKPEYTILVVIDEPIHPYKGVKSATPIFKQIAEDLLRFYPESQDVDLATLKGQEKESPKVFYSTTKADEFSEKKKISLQGLATLLKNKTLREALFIAGQYGFKIKAKGTGRVYKVALRSASNKTISVELR